LKKSWGSFWGSQRREESDREKEQPRTSKPIKEKKTRGVLGLGWGETKKFGECNAFRPRKELEGLGKVIRERGGGAGNSGGN